MKKLPELRRRLSLRSSRSHRPDTDGRGGDAAPGSGATSAPVSSNQNVLSRYHLDSSAPPARAQRRPSRGRSGGTRSPERPQGSRRLLRPLTTLAPVLPLGHLSDGDSPELLPRQQAAVVTQEAPSDITSFQLYMGSNLQRCSQRVTGLLTVHLLGLEEMRSR